MTRTGHVTTGYATNGAGAYYYDAFTHIYKNTNIINRL